MNGSAMMSSLDLNPTAGHRAPLLFALDCAQGFARQISDALGQPLARYESRDFDDGEFKLRPLESVRGHDTYVIHTLRGTAERGVNDRLVRLLFFVAALRDAGARRVTVVTPFLCYARKDRRTKHRDPLSLRYVAQLFEAVGTDCVVVLEVHNPAAFENAFRCPTCLLEADAPIANAVADQVGSLPVVVMSPDPGGVKRAERFRGVLAQLSGHSVGSGFIDKQRSEGVVTGSAVVGEVAGHAVIIVDDMIVTGGTLLRAAQACRRAGAATVIAAATHGLFTPPAQALFDADGPDHIIVTDSVPPVPGIDDYVRLQRVSVARLVADAIAALSDVGTGCV